MLHFVRPCKKIVTLKQHNEIITQFEICFVFLLILWGRGGGGRRFTESMQSIFRCVVLYY